MSIESRRPSFPTPPPPHATSSTSGRGHARAFWTLDRVADALESHAVTHLPHGAHELGAVSTDTRTIVTGDLFVALVGERFDAHDFIGEALSAGAASVVVSDVEKARSAGVPVFLVRDTRAALGALARYRRRAWRGPVVGIVGTNGKTSTKELTRAALDSRLEVHATRGNLNNLVGVPLTLLAIPDHADIAVIEMGTNQPGEIALLRDIAEPDLVVVTCVGEEHLEGLGDIRGVLREEMSACDGVALAIVPAQQPEVVEEAMRRAQRVVTAGLEGGDMSPSKWTLDADGTGRLALDGMDVHVPLRGTHNLRNAVLACAVAHAAGISVEDAARGIARITAPAMRVNWERVGRATLINDAYNSNPGSARAALELLAHAGADAGAAVSRQRVAVLGTMLELGAATERLHDEIARLALEQADLVAGVGEFAQALARIGAPAERIVSAPDAEDVWSALASRLRPDAIILLKGSRGVRLERLVPLVTAWARSAETSAEQIREDPKFSA